MQHEQLLSSLVNVADVVAHEILFFEHRPLPCGRAASFVAQEGVRLPCSSSEIPSWSPAAIAMSFCAQHEGLTIPILFVKTVAQLVHDSYECNAERRCEHG